MCVSYAFAAPTHISCSRQPKQLPLIGCTLVLVYHTKMNLTLNNQFIFDKIGNDRVQRLIKMQIANAAFGYIIPWVAIMSCITNMLVSVLCAIIYTSSMKNNHKPGFVFIGVLSLIDMLVGM